MAPLALVLRRGRFGWPLLLFFLVLSLGGGVRAGDADRSLQVRQMGSCADTAGLGIVQAGLGTDQITGGTFTIAGIPAGAQIVEAWLYWNGADDSNNAHDEPATFNPAVHDGDPTVTLNGLQVPTPQRIGGPANWIGVQNVYAFAYRSDVRRIVTGNGAYVFDGMDNFFGERGYNNGAQLVVVYRHSSLPPTLVGIGEGLDLAYGTNGPNVGPGTTTVFFQFAPGLVKRTATVSVFLGGAMPENRTNLWYQTGSVMPPFPQTHRISGHPDAIRIADPFTGLNNQNGNGFWDSYGFTVQVPGDATWLGVQVESPNVAPYALLDWIGATFVMPLNCSSRLYTPMLLRGVR